MTDAVRLNELGNSPYQDGSEYAPLVKSVNGDQSEDTNDKKRRCCGIGIIVAVLISLGISLYYLLVIENILYEECVLQGERPMYLQPGMTVNPKAVCNNGEPATWHFRKYLCSENQGDWVIRFEGGNCCFDNNTCTTRWSDEEDRRFMTPAATEEILQDPDGGILNGDPERNPDFHSWNAIHMHYCSSDAWMGSRDIGEGTNDSPWVYHGYDILMGLFDELNNKSEYGFHDATRVIIAGYSAGGLSMVSIADAIRAKVKSVVPNAEVIHMCDSGWFLVSAEELCKENMDCLTYNNCPLEEQFKRGYEFWGTENTLDAECILAGHSSNCSAPEISYSFLDQETKDNLILIENQYDQMNHDLHIGDGCTASDEVMDAYNVYLQERLWASYEIAGINSYVSSTCSNHDTTPKDWYYDITLLEDGRNLSMWIMDWINERQGLPTWETECTEIDCNPSCPVHAPPAHVD